MKIWPISTRVNKPANDDASVLEPAEAEDGPSLLSRLAREATRHTFRQLPERTPNANLPASG
jgi:hypothetical protein